MDFYFGGGFWDFFFDGFLFLGLFEGFMIFKFFMWCMSCGGVIVVVRFFLDYKCYESRFVFWFRVCSV